MAEKLIEEFNTALGFIEQKKYKDAIKIMDKVLANSWNYRSVMNNHNITISEWEYIDKITKCERTVDERHGTFEGYLALSLVFKIFGNYDRSRMYSQKAFKIDSNNHRIWLENAETAFKLGEIRQALTYFQEAINFQSEDVFCLEGLGLCYYYLDEPIKAVKPLEKALDLDPDNHSIMNHLAFINSEIGNLDPAYSLIKEALKLEKDNIIYLDTYASILFLQEKFDDALKIYEDILKRNPKDWEVSWDILANIYNEMGLHVKAKQLEEKLHL